MAEVEARARTRRRAAALSKLVIQCRAAVLVVITDARGYVHSVARRNPAVDSVLAAETLIEQLRRVAPAVNAPMPADVTTAIGQVQQIYPEIWTNLDRARSMVGKDVPEYDELRTRCADGRDVDQDCRSGRQAAIFVVAGAAVASIRAKSALINRAGMRVPSSARDPSIRTRA